ncbi:hypothetical protein BRC64_07075 [Halobacteriales archaeon QH_10_67_22]|nr:MAG: hypothetical protein BRC64_07075 [Halobacteriales archaeon QH_10_67_22]
MADEDEEWRFSVDEVGSDDPDDGASPAATDANADAAQSTDRAGVDEGVEGEWVTTVGEEDEGPTVGVTTGDHEAGEGADEGNVAGSLTPERPVEPGTPGVENVVFATAGAVLTALVFAGVVVPLDLVTAGAVTASVASGAGLLYVLFRRF